jgi:UDP-3-O-[3-hydroxymyristoyl] glucosamine N-acyltransferase
MRIDDLAAKIGAEVMGDHSVEVTGVAPLESARPGELSFLANLKYIERLEKTKASAVIVAPNVRTDGVVLLKTKDPYYSFSKAIVLLHGHRRHPFEGIHPRATVEPTASVGAGTVVYPGCYVGPRVRVGRDCILYPNVVIYDDCIIGDRCIVHAGVVIGADGYGFATHDGVHHKIPQIGNVVIEDDVEIGPNTTISRAALERTVIGQGTKIDQNVVIGHNVMVGSNCLLVAQVGLAGSVTLGNHVSIGGQAGVAGHLTISDNVQIAAKTGVMTDIDQPGAYVGIPAMPYTQGRRVYSVFTALPELQKRVRDLEQRVGELSSEDDGEIV